MNFPQSIKVVQAVPRWPFIKPGETHTALRVERRGNTEFLVVAKKRDEILLETKYFEPQVTYGANKR